MIYKFCLFFAISRIVALEVAHAQGCKGNLKFQTAPADKHFDENWALVDSGRRSAAQIRFYANESAASIIDCAKICYDDVIYFCNSAIFEPSSDGLSGNCKLSQRVLSCLSTKRRKRAKTETESAQLLFCFRCVEEFDESIENETATSTVSTDKENSNLTTDSINITRENAFVEESVVEEQKSDSTLTQHAFVQNTNFRFIPLRVMTFNTWVSGSNVFNGVQKIAKHISSTAVDIVALQETSFEAAYQILKELGTNVWRLCSKSNGNNDYVLTRYAIAEEYEPSVKLWNAGCRIRLSEYPLKYLNVWGVHLDWRDYGPYTVCYNRHRQHADMFARLWQNEYRHHGEQAPLGRMNNIMNLMNHPPFQQNMRHTDTTPLIVAGDFNTPSHLDWTQQMRILHCNMSYEWPVSKFLYDSGLKDSYRQIYPDPGQSTGFTWTPLYKQSPDDPSGRTPEPQDRIDFIYYKGNFIRAKSSTVHIGYNQNNRLYPFHRENDWPSDHAAVITEFEILLTERSG